MISTEEVKHVAKLARLELTDEEVNKYSQQLGSILEYVEQMNEVDTTGIEPMPHAIPVYNVMREDVVKYEQTKEYQRLILTPKKRYEILKRDNFKCQICGRTQADGVKLEVDHIIPISKGGKTVDENLRTLCHDCNIGKSDKLE